MKEITRKIISAQNGAFQSVQWESEKKPSAKFKGVLLKKRCRAVARAGVNFANLKIVKEGIASGERGGVQPLPWGTWETFPFTISHNGARYVRLYLNGGQIESEYFVNGEKTNKETFESYLNPSDRAKPSDTGCVTIKEENLIDA